MSTLAISIFSTYNNYKFVISTKFHRFYGTYNEYGIKVLVISIMILITSTILITSCTYNELRRGGLVNGTNTYNETPVYL